MEETTYTLLLIISLLVSFIAQGLVKSRYNKYRKISNKSGLNGENIARKILEANGMYDVKVVPIKGTLTDNYNPKTKTVSLSEDIFYGNTIAGVAVAAHECGHAVQHHVGYHFFRLRTSMVPILTLSSKISYILIVLGLILASFRLYEIGIILEAGVFVFQIVTLPVEFDASKRGLKNLREFNMFDNNELAGCKSMLTAAALTYVGAALSAFAGLLRIILIMNNSRRRN